MRTVSAAFTQISLEDKHRSPIGEVGIADSSLTLDIPPFIACESVACDAGFAIDCGGSSNWTNYDYTDQTPDVSRWEVTSEFNGEDELLGSIIISTANVGMCNSDGKYSPIVQGANIADENYSPSLNGNATIDKPFIIKAGFKNDGLGYSELVNLFYGETTQLPETTNNTGRVIANFYLNDYVRRMLNLELNNDIVLVNVTVDQILEAVFTDIGLSTMYNFDAGEYTLPVFFAKQGTRLQEFIPDLIDSNLGTLRMNEQFGLYEYWNQTHFESAINTLTLDADDIKTFTYTDPKPAISEVEVKWRTRDYMTLRQFYSTPLIFAVADGETRSHTFTIENPATGIEVPTLVSALATPNSGSYFTFNDKSDGTGTDITTGVTATLEVIDERNFIITWSNASGSDGYVVSTVISGREFGIVDEGEIIQNNNAGDSTPRKVVIDLDYIATSAQATDVASRILDRYGKLANPEAVVDVKGIPQIEVGDKIRTVRHDNNTVPSTVGNTHQSQTIQEDWIVRKITTSLDNRGLNQRLTLTRNNEVDECFVACTSLACSNAVICC